MTSDNGMRYHTLHVEGVKIRAAVRAGRGKGLPLLLFNGIGASIELLLPFIESLPDREIIAFDAPGTGESKPPPGLWRPRHHAKLANSLLERLGYSEVHALGVSWGGAIAQQFARQYPRRCRRLILAATSAGTLMVPGKPSVLLRMSNPLRYWGPKYMERIAPKIYGGSLRTNKLRAREHARNMRPPSIKGYYYQLAAVLGWSSLPWLHKLEQPTLVLAGDDDPIVPLINARVLAARIPDARLRVVDCGHLFLLTRARVLAPEIEEFLG